MTFISRGEWRFRNFLITVMSLNKRNYIVLLSKYAILLKYYERYQIIYFFS